MKKKWKIRYRLDIYELLANQVYLSKRTVETCEGLKKQPPSHPSDCRWEQLLLLFSGDSKRGHLPHFLKMSYIHRTEKKAIQPHLHNRCTPLLILLSSLPFIIDSNNFWLCLQQTNTISDRLKGKQRFRELRMTDYFFAPCSCISCQIIFRKQPPNLYVSL